MTSCPSEQELHALLDEGLGPVDEARVVGHLDICTQCQERLQDLTRSGEPHLSWLPVLAARTAADGCPWPRTSSPDDSPGSGGPPHPAPATPTDATVDFGRIAELLTTKDPTPSDREQVDGALAPTDFDFNDPPDPEAAIDAKPQPIIDCQVTTDVIPPKRIEPIVADAIEVDTARVSDDALHLDDDRTVTRSGPSAAPLPVSVDRSRTDGFQIPGYDILEKLGEGGMGVVYKARQQGLNRLVALKMIIGGSQARVDHLARFRIEAEAVARLRVKHRGSCVCQFASSRIVGTRLFRGDMLMRYGVLGVVPTPRPQRGTPFAPRGPEGRSPASTLLWGTATSCRPSRRASFPSLGDTIVVVPFFVPISLGRRLWINLELVSRVSSRQSRWRRQGLPSSRKTRTIIRHVPPTPV